MPASSHEDRVANGRYGAYVLHSKYDSKRLTENARKAFLDRFERQVDPDGVLDPVERARRAEYARKAHFLGLALKSAAVRRKARGAAS